MNTSCTLYYTVNVQLHQQLDTEFGDKKNLRDGYTSAESRLVICIADQVDFNMAIVKHW